MNNNPRKRKNDLDQELKKTKILKDMSIKRKKKGWIKKIFIDKEKNTNENNKKLNINNKNNKNKLTLSNLNIINEEESNKKTINLNININEEVKQDESDNEFGELNMFNKMFKRSQDDFGIELINNKESKKSIINNNTDNDNDNNFNISKYREYLKSKNPNIELIINNEENNLKFLEDININNKGKKIKKRK